MKFVKKQGEYMKFTKLSLVAALLAGTATFAIDNTKVSGDAKLFYSTSDQGANVDLFSKDSSVGEAAVSVALTTDLTENVSAGFKTTAITTLGLYNNLVSATWTGGVTDDYVVSEAWIAATMGNTTGKIGRMTLDTPLVFTETWSIVENTFEAAVLVNQDIPNTTLVGAYVGQHDSAAVIGGGLNPATSPFASFHSGAYAAGVVNNSFKPLTVQAWYFDATHVLSAYWLQADLACEKIPGLLAGVQYTANKGKASGSKTNDAFAVMLGYEMKDVATVKASYSAVGKDGAAGGNLATGATAQSKLYTETWWTYGKVTQEDTTSMNLTVEGNAMGTDLGLYYTNADKDGGDAGDLDELTLTASRSYGPLDVTAAYASTALNGGDRFSTLQAYLTLNF